MAKLLQPPLPVIVRCAYCDCFSVSLKACTRCKKAARSAKRSTGKIIRMLVCRDWLIKIKNWVSEERDLLHSSSEQTPHTSSYSEVQSNIGKAVMKYKPTPKLPVVIQFCLALNKLVGVSAHLVVKAWSFCVAVQPLEGMVLTSWQGCVLHLVFKGQETLSTLSSCRLLILGMRQPLLKAPGLGFWPFVTNRSLSNWCCWISHIVTSGKLKVSGCTSSTIGWLLFSTITERMKIYRNRCCACSSSQKTLYSGW